MNNIKMILNSAVIITIMIFSVNANSHQWKNEYTIVLDYHLTDSPLLNYNDDKNYWQSFFKALAWAESGFDLYKRFKEPGMKDYYTNSDLWSEGLFQLSQQDRMINSCDQFQWYSIGGDRYKAATSDTKHIFQARNQIPCAINILVHQLQKRGSVFTTDNPYYWAVLDTKNPGHTRFKEVFNKIKRSRGWEIIPLNQLKWSYNFKSP